MPVCGGSMLDSVEVYDPSTGEWSDGADLGIARAGHSCVVLNVKLWVVGGKGAGSRWGRAGCAAATC